MTSNPVVYAQLQNAAQVLAARCDGARQLDGQGYSATDTVFGKALALLPLDQWDGDVATAAWNMLSHYAAQLREEGIEFGLIDRPTEQLGEWYGRNKAIRVTSTTRAVWKVAEQSEIYMDGDMIVFTTPYHEELLADIRSIPGRKWDPSSKQWSCPPESARMVWDLATKWNINMTSEVTSLPDLSPAPVVPVIGLRVEDGRVMIRFPWNQGMVSSVRRMVPGVEWSQSHKRWSTSIVNLEQAFRFAQRHNLAIDPAIEKQLEEQRAEANERHDASRALDADIDVPSAIPLLPYQRAGVSYALRTRRTLIADSMGLGKSVQALATLVMDDAFPAVVVCPNTLKLNWEMEAEKFFPHLSVNIVSGTKSEELPYADITVVNYDIIHARADDILKLEPQALVADESHAIKNGKARYRCPVCKTACQVNSKMCPDPQCFDADAVRTHFDQPEETWTVRRTAGVMKIAKAIPANGLVLLLTGTPITNRPAELIPQLIAIGRMEEFGGRWKFQNRYAPGGSGATNLVELNQLLRERCFIRRTQKDVFAELPDLRTARQNVVVDPDLYAEYKRIEKDVVEYLALRAAELAKEAGEDDQAAYWEKRLRAEAAEHLVRISVLRNAVSEMKFKSMIQWLESFLADSDEKVVVFAEHVDMVERIHAHFGDASVKIRGGVKQATRMEAVSRFQNDDSVRVFVGNMAAASEGLTLTKASNIAFLELAWTPAVHAQCASRCYARANDMHGATAWYLLARGTIEDEIFSLLHAKEKVVSAATEGREVTKQSSVLADLVVSLAKRGMRE